jgi:hypothetical protein
VVIGLDSFQLAELVAESDRIVPAHVHDGVLIGLRETRFAPGVLGVLLELGRRFVPAIATLAVALRFGGQSGRLDDAAELAARDLGGAEVERPRDPHAVARYLVV